MFTGKTQNLGIMGWPVEHSLSPAMQNAALNAAGLDYAYIALPVAPEQLPIAVDGLRAMGFRGWNVTIPHKTAILSLLDEVTEDARIIGAVNTVVNDGETLTGYNTDAVGFQKGLEGLGFPENGHAVLLGAGGGARAVLWSLCKTGAGRISIGVRNPEKAEQTAAGFRPHAGNTSIEPLRWDSTAFCEALKTADLLVNTTPIGMYPSTDAMPPVDLRLLPSGAPVYDIIYTPSKTRLLREAEKLGHPIRNGEAMLTGQGAEAFRLWTGQTPNEKNMIHVLRTLLGE